ncbi:MAG: TraR/DksA C4-type zinc finger protein [Bacteroidota bacterium]
MSKKNTKKAVVAKKPAKKIVTKKAVVKKVVAKKPVKKTAPKKVVKKVAPKKAVAKKAIVKKLVKPISKKVASKKIIAKKVIKKVVAKKIVKKAVIKKVIKPSAKKVVAKKVVAKKVVKKVIPKKIVKKAVIKKVSKPVAKKVVAKKVVKKIAPKKIVKKIAKPVAKKVVAKKVSKPVKKAVKPIVKKVVAKPVSKPIIKTEVKPKAIVQIPDVSKVNKPKEIKHVTITIDKTLAERKPTPSKNIVFPSSHDEVVAEVVESKRYSNVDLEEFKEIINKKLVVAREELANLINQLQNPGLNASAETDNSYKTLEDGASTAEKEYISQLAVRQRKFIENLDNALIRIENKTYGICRVTGKLISKDRLRAVPHTTLSMEAKLQQYK